MKILLIAPQPFFINRGTPLAVRNLCRVLGGCGHRIDLLTAHVGQNIQLPNSTIIRTRRLPFKSIGAGFSWKKPLLDIAIALKMLALVRKNNYDVIHCVEESAYIASLLKWIIGSPYICDVDSSIPCQLKEKGGLSSLLAPLAGIFEKRALRKSLCAITVCRALTNIVKKAAPETKVFQLEDPPISDDRRYTESELNSLKEKIGAENKKIVLYMGNFESYQGVELLLHAFAGIAGSFSNAMLVLIGGTPAAVHEKQLLAQKLSIDHRVHFTGLLPPEETTIYLQAADILVSPRTKGENTPMKIYTYMAAGSAILATDMFTHTQVLDHESALLTPPEEGPMAKGLEKLLNDDTLVNRLAARALEIVNEKYSFPAYTQKVKKIYQWVENQSRKNSG